MWSSYYHPSIEGVGQGITNLTKRPCKHKSGIHQWTIQNKTIQNKPWHTLPVQMAIQKYLEFMDLWGTAGRRMKIPHVDASYLRNLLKSAKMQSSKQKQLPLGTSL